MNKDNECCDNPWQGCQSLKITFPELEKVDIWEIRELLDQDDKEEGYN